MSSRTLSDHVGHLCILREWNSIHRTVFPTTLRSWSSQWSNFRLLRGQCHSQWPRGLRRRSAAASLLRLWVRIPPGAWMSVSCECCVLSGKGLGDELITRPEESYRLWCVVVCDLGTSWMRRPWPTGDCCAKSNKRDRVLLVGFSFFLVS